MNKQARAQFQGASKAGICRAVTSGEHAYVKNQRSKSRKKSRT